MNKKPKRANRRWTDEEKQALREFVGEYDDRQIGILLDRKTNAIKAMRTDLRLLRKEQPCQLKDRGREQMEKQSEVTLMPALPLAKPRLRWYLAGKVSGKDDWRMEIVRGMYRWEDKVNNTYDKGVGFVPEEFPILNASVMGHHNWDYVGPYYCSRHGDVSEEPHGAPAVDNHGCGDWSEIHRLCLNAIHRCNVFFAWIDDVTCYGTLVEVGYARALGKPVYIASPPSIQSYAELWFAEQCASEPLRGEFRTPREAIIHLRYQVLERARKP